MIFFTKDHAMTVEQGKANADSHLIGNVDGVSRCIHCEVAVWNAWKVAC